MLEDNIDPQIDNDLLTGLKAQYQTNAPSVLSFGFRKEILRNWPFSHLRSFKKFLWDRINYSSFLDSNKSLLSCACDVAIMCPVLEMAHDKVKFIEDILYIYNRATPLNDDKVDLSDQVRCALEVLNMDRYSKL